MYNRTIRFNNYREQNPNELTNKQLLDLEKEINTPSKDDEPTSDELCDFILWCNGLPSRQESFAKYLTRHLPKNAPLRILDVGCGRIAKLSRILTSQGFLMTAIDPVLDLSYTDGFTGIKENFDFNKFELENFDYVIALEPCDATEHIVRACIEQDVPFIIALCGSPHRLISGQMPKDVYTWHNYLRDLQPDRIRLRYASLDPYFKTPVLKRN